jgi:Class III cytochrome C family/Ferric reductase like transmembrane component
MARESRPPHNAAVIENATNHVSVAWELAQALGLFAALCCLLLCVLPVRPRALGFITLALRKHELLGWIALAAALVHATALPAVDRSVIEHLKPTAPLYEWAGILALVLLLFVTVPASGALRRRLWSRHRNFQALHVAMACLLVASLNVHLVTTDRYVHGRARAIAYLALSAGALLALLRARVASVPPRRPAGFVHGLVFGRHSALLLAIVSVSTLALFAPLLKGAALALREPLVRRTTALAVEFPHEKHRAINCIECHHNFIDRTGDDECYSCHRNNREIRVGIEARFHDFCLGCHRDPPPGLEHHGPVTGCDTCHAHS